MPALTVYRHPANNPEEETSSLTGSSPGNDQAPIIKGSGQGDSQIDIHNQIDKFLKEGPHDN